MGVMMDAIIPFSSILLLAIDDDKGTERDSNDLLMEITYNIENGREVSKKRVEFWEEMKHYYDLQKNGNLTEEDVINFKNTFIDYYENDFQKVPVIAINERKVEMMTDIFFEMAYNNQYHEDNDLEDSKNRIVEQHRIDLKFIDNATKQMEDIYNELKKY